MARASLKEQCPAVVVERPAQNASVTATEDISEATPPGQIDWTQCVSEGGKKDCAKCNNSGKGLLPCDEVKPTKGEPSNKAAACPDDDMGSKGACFQQMGGNHSSAMSGKGECIHLKDRNPAKLTGIVSTTYNFPGAEGDRTTTMDFIDHMLNKGE